MDFISSFKSLSSFITAVLSQFTIVVELGPVPPTGATPLGAIGFTGATPVGPIGFTGAEFPFGPVGPVGPVDPVAPVSPFSPFSPFAPANACCAPPVESYLPPFSVKHFCKSSGFVTPSSCSSVSISAII